MSADKHHRCWAFATPNQTHKRQRCPMCEKSVSIHMSYAKDAYNVRGHKITVRAPMFKCAKCGGEWTNTNNEDGLEKAYTIYVKRTNTQARKFNRLYFKNAVCSAKVCQSCADRYGFPKKDIRSIKTISPCSSKGCLNRARYSVTLGKL